jgi:hypothetical protein
MANLAIVVGRDREELEAMEREHGLRIIPDSIQEFSSVTTYTSSAMSHAGWIGTNQNGWIALAET